MTGGETDHRASPQAISQRQKGEGHASPRGGKNNANKPIDIVCFMCYSLITYKKDMLKE